jgi:hypothetical protein
MILKSLASMAHVSLERTVELVEANQSINQQLYLGVNLLANQEWFTNRRYLKVQFRE